MKRLSGALVLVFSFLVGVSVCNADADKDITKLQDFEHNPTPSLLDRPLPVVEIRKAIIKAARTRRWEVLNETDRQVQLQFYDRHKDRQVAIDIGYDDKDYSIKYVNSTGFGYREENGQRMIDVTYLSWVKKLIFAIDKEINQASKQPAEPKAAEPAK